MGKYVFAYRGGQMAATEAEQAESMQAWMGWFGELGAAIADGGAPFGTSSTVGSDGSATAGSTAGLSGYSVVTADDLASAEVLAKGCPVLSGGGTVEVYEAIEM